MQTHEIAQLIEAGLPGARALVHSADGVHFEAAVIAPQFDGKRARERHRLVYATLGDRVGGQIHALSLQTYAPAEWDERERG
jgi:acid stress-induced BolA-like protein IbaG/YrbA